MCLRAVYCLLVLLCWGAARGLAQDQAPVQTLPAFSRIQTCVPFNVLVSPSGGGRGVPSYGLQVDAEQAVASAINGSVSGDTLQLETGGFQTSQPIKVVIYLPPDQLAGLDHVGQLASVYVNPGFTVDSFALRTGPGAGSAFVYNMTANNASVQTQGTGDVVLTGTYGSVDVTTSGISTVYVSGVTGSVSANLGGISNLYLQPTSSNVQITGRSSGIATVYYSQGQCSVQSGFLVSTACQQSGSIQLQAPTPQWTQGLQAVGDFSCAGVSSFFNLMPTGTAQAQAVQPPTVQAIQFPAGFPFTFPVFQLAPITIPTTAVQTPAPAPAPAPGPAPTPSSSSAAAAMPSSSSAPMPSSSSAPMPASSSAPAAAATRTQPTTMPAPAPAPEAEATNPYALGLQTPTSTQVQRGSVTPGGSTAQSSSIGQQSASATSVATPGQVITSTTGDNAGFTAGTGTGG